MSSREPLRPSSMEPGLNSAPPFVEPARPSVSRFWRGPGLMESCLWTAGVFAAHLTAGIILLLGSFILLLGMGIPFSSLQSGEWTALGLEGPAFMLLFLGGDQFSVLLVSLLAAKWRNGGELYRSVNLSRPHVLHLVLIAGLMLPLSILTSEIYRAGSFVWQQLVDRWSPLGLLDHASSMNWLQESAGSLPLPMLVLAIALGPALSEELIFRGVIGRGLVARWGLPAGILISSALFAAVHLHPVHALAVFPLGIALHLIYLAARSFWAPVWLHFLNNAWATTATAMHPELAKESLAPSGSTNVGLMIASTVAVVVLGTLLYHTRRRYVLDDGREWTPGYSTAGLPPADCRYVISHGMSTGRSMAMAATAWASFAIAFVAELTAWAR